MGRGSLPRVSDLWAGPADGVGSAPLWAVVHMGRVMVRVGSGSGPGRVRVGSRVRARRGLGRARAAEIRGKGGWDKKLIGSSEFADPVRFCEGRKPIISFIEIRCGNRDFFSAAATLGFFNMQLNSIGSLSCHSILYVMHEDGRDSVPMSPAKCCLCDFLAIYSFSLRDLA